MKAFNKMVNGFRKVTGWFGLLGAAGLFIMVAITFVDVFMRYFFKSPIVGSQEMVQFCMVITMFGGMAFASSHGMLLSVDAVTQKFNPTVRRVLKLIFTILCAVCAVLMFIKMLEQASYYATHPMLKSSILKWTQTPFYVFAAVGLCLLAIETIFQIVLIVYSFIDKKQLITIPRQAAEGEGTADAIKEDAADTASGKEEK